MLKFHPPLFSIFSLAAILVGNRDHGHNFQREPSKDHSTKVWLQLVQWFLRRRLKCEMLTDGRRTTDDKRRTKSDDNSSPGLKARWAKKKDSPEKAETQGTPDEEKTKQKHNTIYIWQTRRTEHRFYEGRLSSKTDIKRIVYLYCSFLLLYDVN